MDTTLLEKRARLLAREQKDGTDATGLNVLEFHFAQEIYGFELSYVHQVCALRQLTPVPCTPAFVAGVVNLHGRIVTVIDLGVYFDLPHPSVMNVSHLIVLTSDTMEVGIPADEVYGIHSLTAGALRGSLSVFSDRRKEYLKGIAENRMLVLDAEKILSDPALVVGGV